MKKLIFPFFLVMLACSFICGKSIEPPSVDKKNEISIDSILTEYKKLRIKIDKSLSITKFIPSVFTKDKKLQEELSKFILGREWPLDDLDNRTLYYQANSDYAYFFNFNKPADRIPPLNLQCENEVLLPASVFENDSCPTRQELHAEMWDNFVYSLRFMLANSSNKVLNASLSNINMNTAYLCGQVYFNVDSGIESYVVIVEINSGYNWFSSHMLLITQNEEQVLSVLKLNDDRNMEGHGTISRTIRLDGNILVLQSEYFGDAIETAETEEEALKYGLTNDASFYVYEVLPNGFIKALK
jgi:hypothetical protein